MSARDGDRAALVQDLVAYGRKRGASEIEVSVQEGTESRVGVLEGNIDRLTQSVFRNLNLRVFVDGKAANASSSDLSRETLERLVDNAVARARLAGTDPFAGLPEAEPVRTAPEALAIFDSAVLELTPERRIAIAKGIEAVGLKDSRIKKSTGANCNSFDWDVTLANSKGFAGAYRRSLVTCGGSFQGGEGNNLFQDGWYDASTHLADLKSPEEIGRQAAERVARLIGGKPVASQKVPLVLDPQMGAWLLGFVAQCVDASAVARRQSFLADRVDSKVGNDLVNIVDDGLLVGGRATVPFDDEGVPTRRTTVFEKGTLKTYLADTYWGRKLKRPSTGNAGGSTNFYWLAGTSTPEQIIASVDNGFYMTRFLGLGQEPTTGDISIGAFGLWIEKGALSYPVANITVSANLGTLLAGVEMVGSDLELRDTTATPTLKFAEVTVGGKA